MRQTTQITIEHIVVASDRTYEQVIEALEAQPGLKADWENIARALLMAHASWEQAVQIVEQQFGTSGFTILSKIEPGALLTLSGKPTRAAQYAIGNPLLAIQMIEHAPEVALLVLLDTYYGQSPTLRFPEFVSLFADPAYTALTRAIIQNPAVAQWLLAWQGGQFGGDEQVQQSLLSIIGPQFVGTPSTFPPFIGLTSDLHATVQATTRRLPDLKAFARPVRIIFGAEDPYLDPGVARSLHEALPTSDLSLLPKKGHWPQLDGAPEVAQLLLSIPEV